MMFADVKVQIRTVEANSLNKHACGCSGWIISPTLHMELEDSENSLTWTFGLKGWDKRNEARWQYSRKKNITQHLLFTHRLLWLHKNPSQRSALSCRPCRSINKWKVGLQKLCKRLRHYGRKKVPEIHPAVHSAAGFLPPPQVIYVNTHPHTHTHRLKKMLLGQAPMKAAIHVASLGALKRLHQMFSQKHGAALLSGTEWKNSLVVLTTQPTNACSAKLCEPLQISMAVKTQTSPTTHGRHATTFIRHKTSPNNRKSKSSLVGFRLH